jgi:hypothetical protein
MRIEIEIKKVENGYTLEFYSYDGYQTFIFSDKEALLDKLKEILE